MSGGRQTDELRDTSTLPFTCTTSFALDLTARSLPALGGFRISFITDNIQGAMVVGLIILAVITVGVETKIDPALIASSGLLVPSLLGWQLIYILPVAIVTNDFFISGFWMRTFASKTDKDLLIGTSIATVAITIILGLVGATGLLAFWTGTYPGDPPQSGSIAFFLLLRQLPSWVVGIVLVMTVSLSTAAFDSLQSGMVSTGSNDLFRNKLGFWWIRAAVVVIIVPVVVVALKSPSVLQIYLISDLVSASSIPVLLIGLNERCYWWRGFEVVVGGLGGLMTVFIFGTIYYGNAKEGAYLLLLENGLYGNDWSAFGAFGVLASFLILPYFAAPLFSLLSSWLVSEPSNSPRRCFRRSTYRGPPVGFWCARPPPRFPMDHGESPGPPLQCLRSPTAASAIVLYRRGTR